MTCLLPYLLQERCIVLSFGWIIESLTVNHFVVACKVIFIWSIYHKSMFGGGIKWSYFSLRHWLNLFFLFWSCSRMNTSSFLKWTTSHFRKCNSKSGKYTDLCQYPLTVPGGIIFHFVCCQPDCDHFSSMPNSN